MEKQSNLEYLPEELLLLIFSNLSFYDLKNCGLVCKKFSRIIITEDLWKNICEKYLIESAISTSIDSYFSLFNSLILHFGNLLNPRESKENIQQIIWVESIGQSTRGKIIIWKLVNNFNLIGFGIDHRIKSAVKFVPYIKIVPLCPELLAKTSRKLSGPIVQFSTHFIRTSTNQEQKNHTMEDPFIKPSPLEENLLNKEHLITISPNLQFYPVFLPTPAAKKHSLEGIWVAGYGPHGIEILNISLLSENQLKNSTTDNRIPNSPKPTNTATYQTLPNFDTHFPRILQDSSNFKAKNFTVVPNSYLVAHKLIGDENVFADSDSFVVFTDKILDFQYPMAVSNFLDSEDPETLYSDGIFIGYGRIARSGMRNPSWSPLLIISLRDDPDTFIVWWHELHHSSSFHRKESFSLPTEIDPELFQ